MARAKRYYWLVEYNIKSGNLRLRSRVTGGTGDTTAIRWRTSKQSWPAAVASYVVCVSVCVRVYCMIKHSCASADSLCSGQVYRPIGLCISYVILQYMYIQILFRVFASHYFVISVDIRSFRHTRVVTYTHVYVICVRARVCLCINIRVKCSRDIIDKYCAAVRIGTIHIYQCKITHIRVACYGGGEAR